ncbi:MAG: precorrin-6y C5,15-methyltransferase (decarboxylating) subunit CbiE [Prevotella sp.]|nr:precorrin-6y C5,15-methyltransferase (decarboxylating) subunit CbiE [Prevotella sp.]
MKLTVIGITDHPKPFFPPAVLDVLKSGKVFSGGKRHHCIMAPLLPEGARWIDITVPLDAVFEQYELLDNDVIVFASGDPLFYGIANTIRRQWPDAEIVLYPTFNSLQMLAHRLVMPYHDMRVVSLTGRPWPAFDQALIERTAKIGVLTDREHTPSSIAQRMLDYGYDYYTMYVGTHLGNPLCEQVVSLSLEEAAHTTFEHPNCLILSTNKIPPAKPFGLPDREFELLDGREKMITKMPIRLLTLQALDLPEKRVFWDIGFCTGSVSIEVRLQFPHLHVVAFEIRPECEQLIIRNSRRFGAPGIDVHIGDFLQTNTDDLPYPDAVFIGGHGGRLKEIMAKVYPLIQPGGCIVTNSVFSPVVQRMTDRLSSKDLFHEACLELDLKEETSTHIQLNDYNPINILKCKK